MSDVKDEMNGLFCCEICFLHMSVRGCTSGAVRRIVINMGRERSGHIAYGYGFVFYIACIGSSSWPYLVFSLQRSEGTCELFRLTKCQKQFRRSAAFSDWPCVDIFFVEFAIAVASDVLHGIVCCE